MATPIQKAREIVAARYSPPFVQRAIINGEWDSGSLVRDELAKVEALRKPRKQK